MLKDIRLHTDSDEEKQEQLEQQFATNLDALLLRNINAFQRSIPSIVPYIKKVKNQNISIFCNRFGEFNMVDIGLGRTFYGFHPKQEIEEQYNQFKRKAPYLDFTDVQNPDHHDETSGELLADSLSLTQLPSLQRLNKAQPLPKQAECVVVLGCGLGHHITSLINDQHIQHIIIYEPELQYFKSSALVCDWRNIIDGANEKGTNLYFQLGKDGRDLISDLDELCKAFNVKGCYLYKHYNHPIFDAIYTQLLSSPWETLKTQGFKFSQNKDYRDFYPPWTAPVDMNNYQQVSKDNTLFKENLASLKKFFPEVYKDFINYAPIKWLPVENKVNGRINIIHKETLTPFHGNDPLEETTSSFNNFKKHPNKDGVIFGYDGKKLKHYVHYQFVNKTEKLLKESKEIGTLPNTIKSLIMFGLGLGHQLEHLLDDFEVEKLFICEPNRDFFFASLFSIDWCRILDTINQKQWRLYLNIGDDGSNLIRDLLNQFYSIGPYILSNTYFYQVYYNANLSRAIAQLREQLQVVVLMGEYFDHAFYGIEHTKQGILRGFKHLIKNPSNALTYDNLHLPVFLVGNGPSLDQSIADIKSMQSQAILISCGTSLQVLYKNGITPDFHAEIEQNRATYDWVSRIGDKEYVKNISLLACNGIHPDTADLFKDVYVAFKEGESSTICCLNLLGEDKYPTLEHAFPTVSNFALNVFSLIGFKQLYLFGVDLGFVDNKNHHSKESGYYNNKGEELYDYAESNNTSLIVPGNFRKQVFTKHEFKIAKTLMEELLASKTLDCFNCSDGAKIMGTTPLSLENILLTSTAEQKKLTVAKIKEACFVRPPITERFTKSFQDMYQQDTLKKELNRFIKASSTPFESLPNVEKFVEQQRKLLVSSFKSHSSLFFYLLYGSTNYANALFSKLAGAAEKEDSDLLDAANTARALWQEMLHKIESLITRPGDKFDISNSMHGSRELTFLQSVPLDDIAYSTPLAKDNKFEFRTSWYLDKRTKLHPFDSSVKNSGIHQLMLTAGEENCQDVNQVLQQFLNDVDCENELKKVVIAVESLKVLSKLHIPEGNAALKVCLVCFIDSLQQGDLSSLESGDKPFSIYSMYEQWLVKALHSIDRWQIIIPRLSFFQNSPDTIEKYAEELRKSNFYSEYYVKFSDYLALPQSNSPLNLLDGLKNRGEYCAMPIIADDIVGRELTSKEKSDWLKLAQKKLS